MIYIDTIYQFRRDTEENWLKSNPVLMNKELILVSTDATKPKKFNKIKIGDGVSTFEELEYLGEDIPQPEFKTILDIRPSDKSGGDLVEKFVNNNYVYTAIANTNFKFIGEFRGKRNENDGGYEIFTENPLTINKELYSLTAVFLPNTLYFPNQSPSNSCVFSVSDDKASRSIQVKCIPNVGYKFKEWTWGDNRKFSSDTLNIYYVDYWTYFPSLTANLVLEGAENLTYETSPLNVATLNLKK